MVFDGENIDLALTNENDEGGDGGASPGLVDSGMIIPNTISKQNSNVTRFCAFGASLTTKILVGALLVLNLFPYSAPALHSMAAQK